MGGIKYFDKIAGAWGERNYRIYMSGAFVSLVGLWIHRVALGWLTWTLTESATWLGLIAFADLFPAMLVTPLAGVYADRVNRLHMVMLSQALQMLQAFALVGLIVTGLIEIWSLFFLSLFLGIVASINTAARLAIITGLVSRQHISSAIAIDATLFNLARILGPALAGAIILAFGTAAAFAVNALSFTIFLVALSQVRLLTHAEPDPADHGLGVFAQAVAGVRFAATHSAIRPLIILLAGMALGVKPFMELLPGVAEAMFARGAEALSILTAASGVGAMIGAGWLAIRGRIAGLARIDFLALLGGGAVLLAFAANSSFWLAVGLAMLVGISITICGIATQTLMQSAVDEAVRGRVMSLYGMLFRGAPAIGAVLLGALSDMIGLEGAIGCGGALAIGACLYAWRGLAAAEAISRPAPDT